MSDGFEFNYGLNYFLDDSGADLDGDTLTNLVEYQLNSNPNNADTDGDLLPDAYEHNHGLDLNFNDALLDPDSDTLTNLEEYQYNTNPHLADTDNDGWDDNQEIAHNTDPLDPDDFPQLEVSIPSFSPFIIITVLGIGTILFIKKTKNKNTHIKLRHY